MKLIKSDNQYIQLIDTELNEVIGFEVGALNYKLKNDTVTIYSVNDYFYKNSLWSAKAPLIINDVSYPIEEVGDALKAIFNLQGAGAVSSVNGMQGDVVIDAGNLNLYSKYEIDTKLNNKVDNVKLYDFYNKLEVDVYLDEKVDKTTLTNNYYDKNDIDNKLDSIGDTIEGDLTEVNDNITNITNNFNTQIESIEGDITNINSSIENIEGDITNINSSIENIEGDIVIITEDIDRIDGDIININNELEKKIEVDNLKDGANIKLVKNGNDIIINASGVLTSVEWGGIGGTLDSQTDLINKFNTKADKGEVGDIENRVNVNEIEIENIWEEIINTEHFKGYFKTNLEITTLSATVGDFAFSAESGTKWVFDGETWSDSGADVPDQTVEKSTLTPLMDGVATAGSENKYASGNHRHPTDTSRASKAEFDEFKTLTNNNLNLKADKSTTYTKNEVVTLLNEKVNNSDLINYYNKNEIDNSLESIINNLNDDFYTIDEIDNLLANLEVDLSEYYTKVETDDLLINKQNVLSDITDVVYVEQLPENPESTVLYLIPVD